ncbi:hypothetical protein BD410DRAFT_142397 [Rickenella mellea]|uniref:Uncharacterized protein n=1 Tax=Rickenella mellea TaxID=50990 RepID=A0A4Y7Q7H9_9AGAM|nr:hypothetical protein BD410DRAFT_142397 [Rickenella mellea]
MNTHHSQSPSSELTWQAEANKRLESAVQEALQRAKQDESHIKALESKLANDLSNSRSIHHLLADSLGKLETNRQLVDRALVDHIPHIYQDLHDSMESLLALEERLPERRAQVQTIRTVYDSGRITARELTTQLEWRQASLQDKARRVIFTRTAPVSAAEVAAARLAFCLIFILFVWQFGTAMDGAYRAYRHRLVWGDKLMS